MIVAKGLVMKQFVLNEDNLRKGWGGASEFWFSRPDMQVHSMAELADLDHPEDTGTSAYLLSLGYIPYFYVTDGEVMRAFVQSIGNAKIKAVFDQTPDDAYKEFSEKFDAFQTEYVRKKAADWCYENGIDYTFDTKN